MTPADSPTRRLDQWLWFARFVKSRSLAARLCSGGAVSVNGAAVRKANHAVRPGDLIALAQGPWQRRVRIVDIGRRRGPATEARSLYDVVDPPTRLAAPQWETLLGDE